MKGPELATLNSHVRLVEPDVERDAPLGVAWLKGSAGRETLALMGVTKKHNHESSLAAEQERVKDFIENDKHINWMIRYDSMVVGAIWADLESTDYLSAPSIHCMIGDPNARHQGVGTAAVRSVIDVLRQDHQPIYSRYLVENTGSAHLLDSCGFETDGQPYKDANNLEWQNVILNTMRS